MLEELESMDNHKVWHLVKLPAGKTVLGNRWVYNIKRNEHGEIVRFKARLVAQGYRQVKGDTYDETFSPVVNFSVVRFFFALLVSLNGWENLQCDVKSAYLYAPINDEIYMDQPTGFFIKGKEHLVCRLDRALYGLHQSGRLWYQELNKVLLDLGFEKFAWCNCTYHFGESVVLLVYVDDIVIFGKNKSYIDKVLTLLQSKFDLKVLGVTKKLLGVEFEYNENSAHIHQSLYIDEVCDRFKDFHIPISSLPIVKGVKFSKNDCPGNQYEAEEASKFPYRNLLGCISFIANRTRPDIAYATNIFSQFQSNPGIVHWEGLLRLLGYIRYTRDFKLSLSCNNSQLVAYSDSDFAVNRDDYISLGGQIIMLSESPVSWRTFKEKSVTISTMEAEFLAMCDCVKELKWFSEIIGECANYKIIIERPETPILLADNQSAIEYCKSPIENSRSKHINVKLFFIRDWLSQGIFDLRYVSSKQNLADPFTKPQTKNDLSKFTSVIFVK